MTRSLLLAAMAAVCLSGCAFDEVLMDSPQPQVVYVRETPHPVYFDPYYNEPKIYRQPQYFYESTSKKTKGNKVTKTKTIRNEYGETVYKEKTVKKKKK